MARTNKIVALMFDTLPDILERDCGLDIAAVERVERACGDVREALYAQLVTDSENNPDNEVDA
jgi:hypothetical protein